MRGPGPEGWGTRPVGTQPVDFHDHGKGDCRIMSLVPDAETRSRLVTRKISLGFGWGVPSYIRSEARTATPGSLYEMKPTHLSCDCLVKGQDAVTSSILTSS
jgi:hypothetical protein